MNLKIKLTLLIATIFLVACADDDRFHAQLKNPQDPMAYLDSRTAQISVMSMQQQEEAYQNFLTHYYSPWRDSESEFSESSFKHFVKRTIENYSVKPGYDENQHRHSQEWLHHLIQKINFKDFPNHIQNAIVVRSTYERSLPTNKPSFSSLDKPGYTYPFDNFQNSFLPENLPVKILQVSQDHAWDLVLSNGSIGWVKANTLAKVDAQFIQNWQKNKGYVAFKNDEISVIDEKGIFRFTAHMGAIYPIISKDSEFYTIEIAIKNPDGKAVITSARISKKDVYKIPLLATPENVAKIAKQFLGMPYGWGEMYAYRDCSATTRAVFSYFGIWLPRDAADQSRLAGKKIWVGNLKNRQKLKKLDQYGIPYFTLIHLDGHIMLYLGKKDGKYYVFHDMWGLKTRHLFAPDGRAVVGKTVITPIDFGKNYINVKSTLLDRMTDFILLGQKN